MHIFHRVKHSNHSHKRFRLSRSISLNDAPTSKNIRSVTTFIKKIRSLKQSPGTYYRPGDVVHVRGVNFEIVSSTAERTPHTSNGEMRISYQGLGKKSSKISTAVGHEIDFLKLPRLRRQSSLNDWVKYVEAAWEESENHNARESIDHGNLSAPQISETENQDGKPDYDGNLTMSLRPIHRIHRKPVPAF